MCSDALKARSEKGIRDLVEAVHQSMGYWRIWYYGMQSGAEYLVHEQGGTSERGERD